MYGKMQECAVIEILPEVIYLTICGPSLLKNSEGRTLVSSSWIPRGCTVSPQLQWVTTSLLRNWVMSSTRCSSLFTPRSNHFSKEPWFLWLERSVRNQDWGAGCTLLPVLDVSFRPLQVAHQGMMCHHSLADRTPLCQVFSVKCFCA